MPILNKIKGGNMPNQSNMKASNSGKRSIIGIH